MPALTCRKTGSALGAATPLAWSTDIPPLQVRLYYFWQYDEVKSPLTSADWPLTEEEKPVQYRRPNGKGLKPLDGGLGDSEDNIAPVVGWLLSDEAIAAAK